MDYIMGFGTVIFFILFSFLIFLFTIFLIGLFKKDHDYDFSPKISVLIPMYNEEKNIKKCLDSVFASNYENKEVIVVDDGSTDKSVNIAKKYNVKLLKQNHQGKVDALNLGIKHSSNEFLVTIDADTVIDKNFFTEIVKPFYDEKVGATSGGVKVLNTNTLYGIFQNIEYHNNNLIRNSFSKVFNSGIWFFGSLACYKKSVLDEVGGFKKDTVTEDMDIAMEIKKHGYKTINVPKAEGFTFVPENFKELLNQRSRWWIGGLQTLRKNKKMFRNHDLSTKFLFVNQYWWSFYAFISIPIIAYQVNFWFPQGTFFEAFAYLFRWFSLAGPFYVLYMLPEWGFSLYNIFGVMSGIISMIFLLSAIRIFNDKLNWKNVFAIFFYFPYTIVLNLIVLLSVIRIRKNSRYFIK